MNQNIQIESLLKGQFDRELRSRLTQKLVAKNIKKPAKKPIYKFKLVQIVSGIAASILLFFCSIGINPNMNIQEHRVVVQAIGEKIIHPGLSKGSIGTLASKNEAIALFNKQNFADSYSLFSEIENPLKGDLFYKAMCMFYMNQFEAANSELQSLLISDSAFFEEVRWFLAITELKLGDSHSAATLLSEISPNEWNYSISQELLNRIKN